MRRKKFSSGKKLKLEQVEDDLCLPFLYDLPLPSSLIYIQSTQEMKFFEEIIFTKRVRLVGMDTETEPLFGHKTSLIQLAIRYEERFLERGKNETSIGEGEEHSRAGEGVQQEQRQQEEKEEKGKENVCDEMNNVTVEERIFILDLLQLSKEDHCLVSLNEIFQHIFQNHSIVKVAHGLKQDATELVTSYPTFTSFNQITTVLETNSLHQKLNPQIVLPVSLKYLVRHYLHSNLIKAHQCSSWGSRPLTSGQLNYAACDALVLLRLYDAMCFEIQDVFLECDLQECMVTIDLTKSCDSPTKKSFREIANSPSSLSPSLTISSASQEEDWNLAGQKSKSRIDNPPKSSRRKKRRKVLESDGKDGLGDSERREDNL